MSDVKFPISFPINNVTFVGSKNCYGFQDVLNDIKNASKVRILTYSNISQDFLDELRDLGENVDIKIILSPAGLQANKATAYTTYDPKALETKLEELREVFTSEKYKSKNVSLHFCFKNHAKIIGTNNVLYVGSENYSIASRYNYEAGFLINDAESIKRIYTDYFDQIKTVELTNKNTDLLRVAMQVFLESVSGLSYIPGIYDFDVFENDRMNAQRALKSMQLFNKKLKQDNSLESDLYNSLKGPLTNIEQSFNSIEQKFTGIFDCIMSKNGTFDYDNLYEYFEDIHSERKGVRPDQEWIDEDTRYMPLIDDPDRDFYVEEYLNNLLCDMSIVDEYSSLIGQCNEIFEESKCKIEAAINKYDELKLNAYDLFKDEVIKQGEDKNTPK